MTSDRQPAKDKPPAGKSAEREAKLAQALRANLRRRKASSGPKDSEPADGESG
jgi:hypothetical protein